MSDKILQIHDTLRQKTIFNLIENTSTLGDSNPFREGKIPLMCDFCRDHHFPSDVAYESGNRSLFFRSSNNMIKAKGVGIPIGFTRPFFDDGCIYSYKLLNDPGMCHKSIFWGFMEEEEFLSECYGAKKAEELGQRVKLLGYTSFNIFTMALKDRPELFAATRGVEKGQRFENILKKSSKEIGYSVFYSLPSDIRVQEILFTFIFPQVTELIDKNEIKDYTSWLGESCGTLLNQYHRSGSMHGTWLGEKTVYGFLDIHSNSYTGNYVVDEEGITMCDFDLAKPIGEEKFKEIEKWSLIHMENPLHYAGSLNPSDSLKLGIARKNPFREELAEIFRRSVEKGYTKKHISIDKTWIIKMLEDVARSKSLLWKLYELPLDVGTRIDYIDHVISSKKIDKNRLNEILNS